MKSELLKNCRIYESMINSSNDLICVLDEEHRFVFVNDMFLKQNNTTKEEVLNKKPLDIQIDQCLYKDIKLFIQQALNGDYQEFSKWQETKVGKKFFNIKIMAFQKRPEEKAEGVIITIQDQTKQKNMEKEIFNQKKKAAMGDLLGIIAHQLKQPLNNISLASDDLLDQYEYEKIDKESMEYFYNSVQKSISFMSVSINELRNFFRTDRKIKPFSLSSAIEKSTDLIVEEVRRKNINFHFDLDSEIFVNGLENELQQVILNIINNSKDALIKNKVISPFIKISTSQKADKSFIEICDNGGGIDEKIMGKIFDSYFTTKEEEGTGIGLNLSKMIVENSMGGNIKVENSQVGAVFSIELPSFHKAS
ncbi:MAG: PAS domain-containing sensor histidine kinase [Campylobacterales bacterium]|nr:PAS domain-containing sensor histidine kinase [Campylobacterales bacterium]